jgi:hypothetical protein
MSDVKRHGLDIAILSFDRPGYLAEVLSSLSVQLSPADRVYLFQDGGWNPHSQKIKAAESAILDCAETFARIIPAGRAFVSPVNLGIAGNYRRAEEFIFDVLEARHALLLEDDLVLSSLYLDVIDELLQIAAENPNIGYVSAYGDLWARVEDQEKNESGLQPMHENWGSAMTRESWLKQKPIREEYWKFVEKCDYRDRDTKAIAEMYAGLGYTVHHSSQDGSRWVACAVSGLARVTVKQRAKLSRFRG